MTERGAVDREDWGAEAWSSSESRLGRGWRRRWWWALPAIVLMAALLPSRGEVLILPESTASRLVELPEGGAGHVVLLPGEGSAPAWPRMRLAPESPRAGQVVSLWVTDRVPWAHMRLTVNGRPARYEPPPLEQGEGQGARSWTWEWTFEMPEGGRDGVELVFYHDCHLACVERGRMWLVAAGEEGDVARAVATRPALRPTELGVVFPHPERDWHGRAGWAVELSYAREPEVDFWGIDDLAGRVWAHRAKGLRVLLRVDYDRQQSLPPAGNPLALEEYLAHARRLAADARLSGVEAFFYGSGYNADDANRLAGQAMVTPEWYARVFNGAGLASERDDNLVERVRAVRPDARLLVGPLRPFATDRGGDSDGTLAAPWLRYFDELVRRVGEGARAKAALGRAGRPDGFALHVPGRPEALERLGGDPARESQIEWYVDAGGRPMGIEVGGRIVDASGSELAETEGLARGGFGVHADWLAIINAHPQTRGLPAYITSANTFAPEDGVLPAEGYPAGWLQSALAVVAAEPQIEALCWFVDGIPGDRQWGDFQLSDPKRAMTAAAADFDALLRGDMQP